MNRDINEFKERLGIEAGEILEYCLGKNWKSFNIRDSRKLFNEKLSIEIDGDDDFVESAIKIRKSYCIIKRDNNLIKLGIK